MRLRRLTLENKILLGIGLGFIAAVASSVVGVLVKGPVAVSELWWLSMYQALGWLSIPIIVVLGFYYAKKWERPYPFALMIVPNLLFLLVSITSDVALAALTATQLFFLFPRISKTPTLKPWAYASWAVVYISFLLLFTLSIQIFTGMI